MITVLFFAALREKLACDKLTIDAQGITTVDDVKHVLVTLHPHWQAHLTHSALLFAVNNAMVALDHPVKAGDEVAFFPPVTGG